MAEFTTVIEDIQNTAVIRISGYLDAHTAPKLEDAFNEQILRSQYRIVIDFENLKYISSAGLGVFMAFIETMRSNSGDIKLAAMQPNVFNIFDLLGFPYLYEIFPDTQSAIQKFAHNPQA